MKIFEKELIDAGEEIIIYGAGMYGEITYIGLREWGLTPTYFCDRARNGEKFLGLDVISPEVLKQHQNAHVLIASSSYFYDIKRKLDEIGHQKYYSVENILECAEKTGKNLTTTSSSIYYLWQRYKQKVSHGNHRDSLDLLTVQLVVTERCTLRCRNCISCMQYYQHAENYNFSKEKVAFDRLLDCVDSIAELNIIGGEPFLNPEVGEIIKKYANHPKIHSIVVLTNGMVMPNEETIAALKNPKVALEVSDYGINSAQVERFFQRLESENIRCCKKYNLTWHDLGPLNCRGYDETGAQTVFSKCEASICHTFLKGKYYICPPSAHYDNLDAVIAEKDDYVDFARTDITIQELRGQLQQYVMRSKPVKACYYCNGRDPALESIPAAIQTATAIPFDKQEREQI